MHTHTHAHKHTHTHTHTHTEKHTHTHTHTHTRTHARTHARTQPTVTALSGVHTKRGRHVGQTRVQKQSVAFLFPLFLSSPTVTASVSYWARRCCPLPEIQSAGKHGCVHGRLLARHHTCCTLTEPLCSHLHTSQSEPEYLLCKCMFTRKLPCGAQSKTKTKQ